ncbi:hypothetical protein ACLOJK_037260 [Asimina triloba]
MAHLHRTVIFTNSGGRITAAPPIFHGVRRHLLQASSSVRLVMAASRNRAESRNPQMNIRQKTHPIADLKSKQGSRPTFFRHHPIQAWWARQQNPPDPAIMEQRSERVCHQISG